MLELALELKVVEPAEDMIFSPVEATTSLFDDELKACEFSSPDSIEPTTLSSA